MTFGKKKNTKTIIKSVNPISVTDLLQTSDSFRGHPHSRLYNGGGGGWFGEYYVLFFTIFTTHFNNLYAALQAAFF